MAFGSGASGAPIVSLPTQPDRQRKAAAGRVRRFVSVGERDRVVLAAVVHVALVHGRVGLERRQLARQCLLAGQHRRQAITDALGLDLDLGGFGVDALLHAFTVAAEDALQRFAGRIGTELGTGQADVHARHRNGNHVAAVLLQVAALGVVGRDLLAGDQQAAVGRDLRTRLLVGRDLDVALGDVLAGIVHGFLDGLADAAGGFGDALADGLVGGGGRAAAGDQRQAQQGGGQQAQQIHDVPLDVSGRGLLAARQGDPAADVAVFDIAAAAVIDGQAAAYAVHLDVARAVAAHMHVAADRKSVV